MIDVRLFATLQFRGEEKRKQVSVEPEPGLTPREVIGRLGLDEKGVHIVMVNGTHASLDDPLADGDRLGLFPPIGGG